MKLVTRDQLSYLNCHYYKYSLDYFLDTMEMLGVPNVELVAGHQGVWLDHNGYCDVQELKRKLIDRHLSSRILTPQNCITMYQFAAPGKELYDLSYRYFSNGLRMAAELGCELLEVNSGWGYWTENPKDSQNRCIEMFSKLCILARELGITMVIESLRPQESLHGDTIEKIKTIYDSVNSEQFKVMIDLTAMSVAGESIQQWFDTFGSNILHVHFQDRAPLGHLIWGDGNESLEADLRALKENGYTGLISAEITDDRYSTNPRYYDTINVRNICRYL